MTGAVAASINNVGALQRERLGQKLMVLLGGGKPAPGFASTGGWRIQVGTFRTREAALTRLDETIASVPELAKAGAQPSSYGSLTRARFVGLPDEASAGAICARVEASGTGCFVLPPR